MSEVESTYHLSLLVLFNLSRHNCFFKVTERHVLMASCLPEFIAALCWKYIHFTVVSDCLAWSCCGSASRSWVTDCNLISREQWNRKIEVSQSEDSLKHYVIMFTLSRSNKKKGGGCPFMKINSSLFLNSSQFPVFFSTVCAGSVQ